VTAWGPEVASLVRWDWYQGTVFGGEPVFVAEVLGRAFGDLVDVVPSKPKNGYLRGCQLVRGEPLCSIWWGGNPGAHVLGTGQASPEVASVVRSVVDDWRWEWSPSRVDACVDWIEAGLFDELASFAMQFAKERGVSINQQGDWYRGEARTLYLGSRESTVQLVLYEKGYEAGGDPSWVRFEVRVRPKGHARIEVGRWEPATALGACAWLRDLVQALGLGARITQAVGTVWRPSDAERARRAMVKQYGRVMLGWFEELGSWERVGVEVGAQVIEALATIPVQPERSESIGDSCAGRSSVRWAAGALARVGRFGKSVACPLPRRVLRVLVVW